jgi:hypothetical protein
MLIKKDSNLFSQKANTLSRWQDTTNFCLPRKAWMTTMKIDGQPLNFNYLYDSRAILAVKESAAGFHSNLTNPSSKWFGFRTLQDKFMQAGHVQRYFKDVTDIQFGVINGSNWDETMLEYYTDDLVLGNTDLITEEDEKTHVRYTEGDLANLNVERDDRGELRATYMTVRWTVDQCITRFGFENLSKAMKEAWSADKSDTKFEIMHYVGPRNKRDAAKKDSVNMEFYSLWIGKKEAHILAEGGFEDHPHEVTMFYALAQDPWGYAAADDVLAYVKLANAQKRTIIRRAMKDGDQATAAPFRFWMGQLNQNPGAMNYYDATKFTKEQFFPIPTGGDPKLAIEMMQLEQDLIERGFYLPLFRSLSNVTKEMSVPEVQKRISENLALVGPVCGRMTKGIARAQLRTYKILDRRILFPPAPKEIQGQDLKMIFLSPLAKAQRSSELNGLMTWLQIGESLAKWIPSTKDKIDGDRIMDGAADLLDVDPTYIREDNVVKQIRAKQAQIQQQQMKMQMAEQAAGAAKNAAGAKKAHAEAGAIK